MAELAEFSKIWDYRSGKSRLMFHDDQDLPDPHEELTYRAAKKLGLMNPVPPSQDAYDYMLILGGLATGVEHRVKYAASLVSNGLRVRRQIAALGSFRELHEKEIPVARPYAPGARYGIDHLAQMVTKLFYTDGDWTEVAEAIHVTTLRKHLVSRRSRGGTMMRVGLSSPLMLRQALNHRTG